MAFYSKGEFTLSCLDGSCDGQMELDFTELEVSDGLSPDCPECGHSYSAILLDFEDTADGERELKVYA